VLLADEKLISQVMVNLIKNAVVAVKHTENKIISIHAIKQNDAIQISVADNGEGIPPENLDQVFLPFFTTRKEGSGIGLSLCKQIMMLHGGSIRLKSELGHGTMISLQF
jgi:signal transduction histidine kinase